MNAINNLVKDIATKKEKVPKASAAHPLDQDSSTPVVTQATAPPVDQLTQLFNQLSINQVEAMRRAVGEEVKSTVS
jgi:cell envelope opacity-associated protein A